MPLLQAWCQQILDGDMAPLDQYELLAGPVPTADQLG